jgi:hypothetical protein
MRPAARHIRSGLINAMDYPKAFITSFSGIFTIEPRERNISVGHSIGKILVANPE